ncbi:MAG: hypothetical protein U9N78_10565, partial [Actinomycetota bacterium]|nr:hypothetical protein [Actinomycetota bacterium]
MAREIYAYKCRLCDTMHYPFRMVCKNCKQNDFFEFDTVPLPRDGKLLTFTKVYNLPPQYEVPTLGLGIVELEEVVLLAVLAHHPERVVHRVAQAALVGVYFASHQASFSNT